MQSSSTSNQVDLVDPQTILDSITDAFFTLNANWEFCYVSRQTETTLGRKAGELLGKSIWEVYPGTVGSEFERVYRKWRWNARPLRSVLTIRIMTAGMT
jgi:PAS domain S-box-containing protein